MENKTNFNPFKNMQVKRCRMSKKDQFHFELMQEKWNKAKNLLERRMVKEEFYSLKNRKRYSMSYLDKKWEGITLKTRLNLVEKFDDNRCLIGL